MFQWVWWRAGAGPVVQQVHQYTDEEFVGGVEPAGELLVTCRLHVLTNALTARELLWHDCSCCTVALVGVAVDV